MIQTPPAFLLVLHQLHWNSRILYWCRCGESDPTLKQKNHIRNHIAKSLSEVPPALLWPVHLCAEDCGLHLPRAVISSAPSAEKWATGQPRLLNQQIRNIRREIDLFLYSCIMLQQLTSGSYRCQTACTGVGETAVSKGKNAETGRTGRCLLFSVATKVSCSLPGKCLATCLNLHHPKLGPVSYLRSGLFRLEGALHLTINCRRFLSFITLLSSDIQLHSITNNLGNLTQVDLPD